MQAFSDCLWMILMYCDLLTKSWFPNYSYFSNKQPGKEGTPTGVEQKKSTISKVHQKHGPSKRICCILELCQLAHGFTVLNMTSDLWFTLEVELVEIQQNALIILLLKHGSNVWFYWIFSIPDQVVDFDPFDNNLKLKNFRSKPTYWYRRTKSCTYTRWTRSIAYLWLQNLWADLWFFSMFMEDMATTIHHWFRTNKMVSGNVYPCRIGNLSK